MGKLVLTIDVEDWFCVRNMREVIPFASWKESEIRVRVGMDFILTELSRRNIKATFFVLGWIAEKCPAIVSALRSEGHEIASHGYNHQPIDKLSPEEFAADLRRSVEVLGPQAGRPIEGYRAPSFSITKNTLWALDLLAKEGFAYDSSVYPVRHPDYGIPDFPRAVTALRGLTEVPMSVFSFMGVPIPVSGGGYFRLYPYELTRRMIRGALGQGPVVLYFHPWEFDEGQPRIALPAFRRFRHYVGLRANREKFRRLLDDFSVCSIGDLISKEETWGCYRGISRH